MFRLYTASADVITQVASHRADFPKPTDIYEKLSIFGANVVSTEGHDWRRHRKVTSPSFTEKANATVFEESLQQLRSMMDVRSLAPGNSLKSVQIPDPTSDFMRVSLHVISRAGFGIKLAWPGRNHKTGKVYDSATPASQVGMPPGYTMSFFDSTNIFMRNIIIVAVFGKHLLSGYPSLPTITYIS
jgi:cytochrome P450